MCELNNLMHIFEDLKRFVMKKLCLFVVLAISLVGCGNNSSRSNNDHKGESQGVTWHMGDIIDKWDEPTGEHYLYADFYGAFSNSATAGSKLRIRFYAKNLTSIEYDYSYYFNFDEYNDGTYEDEEEYCEYIKVINKATGKVFLGNHPDARLEDKEGNYYMLEDIMASEGAYEIKMRSEYGTVYLFTIDTKGIDKALVKAGLKRAE